MADDKTRKAFEKQEVDEEHFLNVIGGEEPIIRNSGRKSESNDAKTLKSKSRTNQKNADYAEVFLTNRYSGGRNGKVVYIRPEFHQRLLRMVQLDQDSNTTLYAYIDNILDHHFKTFGDDITNYFNDKYKPII